MESNEQYPKTDIYYKNLPSFDLNRTFSDGSRHMNHPLDETYQVEPEDAYTHGMLPPEEVEVREIFLSASMLRFKLSKFEVIKGLFEFKSKKYKAALDIRSKLNQLPGKSAMHRAAFLRLANGRVLAPGARLELKRIVDAFDQKSSRHR